MPVALNASSLARRNEVEVKMSVVIFYHFLIYVVISFWTAL